MRNRVFRRAVARVAVGTPLGGCDCATDECVSVRQSDATTLRHRETAA